MKKLITMLAVLGIVFALAPAAVAGLSITNGNFEADAIGGSQDFADVAGWYESDADAFWSKPWFKEGNDSFKGTAVVAFSGLSVGPAIDGAGLLGGYLYQNIGSADGAVEVQIGFQTSTFLNGPIKDYGITVTILQTDGTFVPGEEVDILGAAGVTVIDQQTAFYTGAAAAGVKDDVWTLDLSSAGAGDLYLRLNFYHGAVNDEPFIHMDNVAIVAIVLGTGTPTTMIYWQ